MPVRARRDFDALTEAQLLAGRTTARRVDPDLIARTSAEGREAARVADLLDVIAEVAEAATGERSFLHLKAQPAAESPAGPRPRVGGPGPQVPPSPVETGRGAETALPGRASGDPDVPGQDEPRTL